MSAGRERIVLKRGDITREEADVIVNAANTSLLGGGGVDGAIHAAGGPEILAECRVIHDERGGCPTGEAVATTAGRLPARWVVHTVGPVWSGGGDDDADMLASCYRESLERAREKGARTVAFPAISTGAFGYPMQEAAAAAVEAVAAWLDDHDEIEEVRFVLFSDSALGAFRAALGAMGGEA